MLRGKGSNCFNNNLLMTVYNDYEDCGYCHNNGADCFDHVEPRSGKYTNSILNACPVHNQKCNIAKHGEMHTFDNKVKLILFNMKRLQKEKYSLLEVDKDFILEYKTAQEALNRL